MDPIVPSPNDSVTDELKHITQEIYLKNAALSQTNKTLSLLSKIDEIILGSLTDPIAVAQEVANITALEGGYKAVAILLYDNEKKVLKRIAVSQTDEISQLQTQLHISFVDEEIPLNTDQSLLVTAFIDKTVQVSHNMSQVVGTSLQNQASQMQEILSIATVFVYPMIVRGESIGLLIMALDLNENNLSGHQHDLRERLPGVIGVAMDNALLYQQIESANEKLKALDKLKDEFVSLASHELRTPMTAIKSYLWMALAGKGGPLSEKQKYYLDRAYNSTDRLIKLVNEMLNVSRIESGRIMLDQKEIDMNTLSDDVLADVMPRAQELGIQIEIKHIPLPHVYADENKMKEVFINLIGNSLKFTPTGGKITISFQQIETMIATSVTDTGKGIAVDDLPKLFQKFGKVDNNYMTAQNVQGTGLGLYISKAIVQLHGGDMSVRSDGVGQGTTFTFTLPLFTGQQKTIETTENAEAIKDIIPTQI